MIGDLSVRNRISKKLDVENQEFNRSEGYLVNINETNFGLEFLGFSY
jgi:hypothetical protein